MFSKLGGEDSWRRPVKTAQPDDEFHLGNISNDDLVTSTNTGCDPITEILDRYPVDYDRVQHLEGEERAEAAEHLYRSAALRDARTAAWIRDQCAPLLLEYHQCLRNTRIRIPYITCTMEQEVYTHCLDVSKV